MNRNEWQRGQGMKRTVRTTALAILTCMHKDRKVPHPYTEMVADLLAEEALSDQIIDASLDMTRVSSVERIQGGARIINADDHLLDDTWE